MSAIATHLDAVRSAIFKVAVLKKYATMIEEKTKVNVEYFVLGAGVVLAICIFSGFCANFITNLVGFSYPAYRSIVAIESKTKSDDTQWLTYWVVFAAFCVVENFADYILYWVPFFYAIKFSFLVWCMIPKYNGAQIIYDTVLKPIFLKHESAIDSALGKLDSATGATAATATATAAAVASATPVVEATVETSESS